MGMAKHGARNPDFSCQVRASFKRMAPESAGRARLLAAAGGTSLFSELKALEHLQTAWVQGELLQHGITINNYGNQTLSSGIQAGTINAQNVAGNDVSVENNQANQQFAPDPSAQAELIGRIIEFARSGALPPGPAHEVIERAEAAAAAPTPERRTALLDTLKGVAEGVAAAGSAGTALAGLIAAASKPVLVHGQPDARGRQESALPRVCRASTRPPAISSAPGREASNVRASTPNSAITRPTLSATARLSSGVSWRATVAEKIPVISRWIASAKRRAIVRLTMP